MATSPLQPLNQLSCTGDTLEHLRKAHLGFGGGFRFLLCKKNGILLISELLPNSDAKGNLPLGVVRDWSIVRKLLGQGICSDD
jgi:hypothetical protein